MKRFIVKCVEIISYLGFFAFIIGGASGGYQRVADLGGIKPVWGALLGAILGFVLGVIVFGVLFLLLDIDDNTRRTRELLEQVPETTVNTIERCSGHDGTWGIKSEFYADSMKIGRPVFRRMNDGDPDYVSSDCPIAGRRILEGLALEGNRRARKEHPLTLLRIAYGLPGS